VEPKPPENLGLSERDISRWRLVEDFQSRLAQAAKSQALSATWSDSKRELSYGDYLSLFLLGLLNPVVRTMRGLCAASHLKRVQEEVCHRPVSLGSFSEAQAVLDPALLAQVFGELSLEISSSQTSGCGPRAWLIQDSSLFEALPRMHWCLWRRQGKKQSQVRLHLALAMEPDSPARASVTPGKGCERKAWRTQWRRGDAYIGDTYYGEDYQMFGQLDEAGVAFAVRLRDQAVLQVQEELPIDASDQRANVLRQAWVHLGCKPRYRSIRLRVVWVQTPKEVLRLVTNISPVELSAADVALLYKQRWQIELFFRWIKCVLGCRHWLAESPQGAAIQLYLALIAAMLLQLYTGQRPNRRMMELIQFYLLGVATLEELWEGLEKQRQIAARQKKS
jgi:hypothetical protein